MNDLERFYHLIDLDQIDLEDETNYLLKLSYKLERLDFDLMTHNDRMRKNLILLRENELSNILYENRILVKRRDLVDIRTNPLTWNFFISSPIERIFTNMYNDIYIIDKRNILSIFTTSVHILIIIKEKSQFKGELRFKFNQFKFRLQERFRS